MQIPSRDWFNTETDYVKFKYLKKGKQSINIMDLATETSTEKLWYDNVTYINSIDKSKLKGNKYGKIEITTSGDSSYPNVNLSKLVKEEYAKGNTTFYFSYEDWDVKECYGLFAGISVPVTFICDLKLPINTSFTRFFQDCLGVKQFIVNFNDIPVNSSTSYVFDGAGTWNYTLIEFNNCPYVPKQMVVNTTNLIVRGLRLNSDLSMSRYNANNVDKLQETIRCLKPVTTTQTLTLGSTNLALLTDEDKKIATDKGWTLA